ncbi:Uncharacterised protein [Burkholderia pseudomallei]|nr:hypothetical protein BBL_3714 [Burkholderia pseudomallei MSHR1328]CAK0272658.1 Uncharacterised protein [Burkholderia pseudomallei]
MHSTNEIAPPARLGSALYAAGMPYSPIIVGAISAWKTPKKTFSKPPANVSASSFASVASVMKRARSAASVQRPMAVANRRVVAARHAIDAASNSA